MGQWTAAVLLVVAAALAAAWLYQAKGETVEVLVVTRPVAAGVVVQSSDLGTAQVSGVSGAVGVEDVEEVLGQRAVTGLVPGQVLTGSALTTATVPGLGQKVVALRLDPGRVPDGVATGGVVDVLAVPVEGDLDDAALDEPPVLSARAQVVAVEKAVDGSLVVSVLVEDGSSDRLAAYAATGRTTIIQAPTGDPDLETGQQPAEPEPEGPGE